MRRAVLSVVAVLVVIVSGPQSFSMDGDGTYAQDIVNNYYSDNSYSSAVGWDERDCSSFTSGGSTSDWRYHEVYSCDGIERSSSCQEYRPGTGWVNVACPDTTVSIQARVHIPVG